MVLLGKEGLGLGALMGSCRVTSGVLATVETWPALGVSSGVAL